jgi:urease accessory protein
MVVFGRLAMGETVETGALNDQWRVRRGGRLVFAEAVRLDGPLRALMDRAAIAGGARAAASIVYIGPDAEDRLAGAREALGKPAGIAAVGAWNGLLTGRFLGQRPHDVRADVSRLARWLNRRPMPRSWSI